MKRTPATEQEFEAWRASVSRAVRTDRAQPEQVFQPGYGRFVFGEFDWCMLEPFWSALQTLAAATGDDSIIVAMLAPDPVTYARMFGSYGWFSLPVDAAPGAYWAALDGDPSAPAIDPIGIVSETMVWLPPSGRWAIWGERSFGVSVLGVRDDQPALADPFAYTWHSMDDLFADLISLNFKGRVVPPSFAEPFRANYGSSAT